MIRRISSFAVAIALAGTALVSITVPAVFAAGITCTPSTPGYQTWAVNVFFDPPQRPTLETNGGQSMITCGDGLGFSVQRKSYDKAYTTDGRPAAMTSIKLGSDFGDDCGSWDVYNPVTYFNMSSQSHTAGWHWQPVVVCGFAPRYNNHSHASGTLLLSGVFQWDWQVGWP